MGLEENYISTDHYMCSVHKLEPPAYATSTVCSDEEYSLLSFLPVIVIFALSVFTRNPILSMATGTAVGWVQMSGNHVWFGLLRFAEQGLPNALGNSNFVLTFAFIFIGVVGVGLRSGGFDALAEGIAKCAKDSYTGQIMTYFFGYVIFFDDYSNTMIVGNILCPVTDKFKISREKLSFIVDCTAAPIASLFMISTWISYELGQIDSALEATTPPYTLEPSSYLFVASLGQRFYAWFMLAFVFFMALSGRDWGPMYYAEKAIKKDAVAVTEDASAIAEFANMPQVMAKEGIKAGRWWNGAVVPFMTVAVILPMLYYSGLCRTGHNAGDDDWSGILNWGDDGIGFKEIIGNADPYAVLIQQATAVFFLMMVMYVIQGKEHTFAWGGSGPLLWPKECIEAACKQCGHVWEVFVILIFANAIGSVMKELNGKLYLQCALDFEVEWVPVMTFILCAINSLATGTSWGTMAIFMPISVPLVIDLARLKTADGTDDDTVTRLLITTIAAVLGGAIWGDHCSLISDTTILSAMACRINPWDHFKTQFPYAIFCGAGACGALIAQAAYGDDIEEMMGLEPSTAWWIILPAGMLGVPLASVILTFIPFLGGPIPVYTPSKGIIGSGTSGVCTVICCKNSEGTIPDEESTKV